MYSTTNIWPTRDNYSKFGVSEPFMNAGRIERFDRPMDNRQIQRINEINNLDPSYIPYGPPNPFVIPQSYEDPENEVVPGITKDTTNAVDFAFRWKLYGDEAAGQAAIRILEAWTVITSFGTNFQEALTGSNRFPLILQAVYMVRDRPDYTPTLNGEMVRLTNLFLENTRAYISETNHSSWGLCMLMAGYTFLGDRERFNDAIYRWRRLNDLALVDSEPVHELYRQGAGRSYGATGLHYTTFYLNGMVCAAEWARFNGVWLYDYVTPNGSSIKRLWEKVCKWTNNPAIYPYNSNGQGLPPETKPETPTPSGAVRIQAHHDVLHAIWPNEDSQDLIDKYTTTQDRFGMRNSLLIYRGLPLRDS